MGNCQATDAAAVVIHHPDGRIERLYWPTSAGEIMRSHPGHYVTLVTFYISRPSTHTSNAPSLPSPAGDAVRLTRVRLLRHKDILLVGQVYRLVTSQELTKAINARKQEKMRKDQAEQRQRPPHSTNVEEGGVQGEKNEKERQKNSRHWRPSLQSISEAGS
ncbi:uncharacterized protein LOC110019441 [Phalaenopsis equestris]|uniref:uncharacterized protein LOC110019441 n=1 Tax=Phalaenopsis equestris TaxID=78828 RepID=UPI0009E406A1|nr:uncharacterized protein LOC110019441 [Phalaenopsis equestris]